MSVFLLIFFRKQVYYSTFSSLCLHKNFIFLTKLLKFSLIFPHIYTFLQNYSSFLFLGTLFFYYPLDLFLFEFLILSHHFRYLLLLYLHGCYIQMLLHMKLFFHLLILSFLCNHYLIVRIYSHL